MTTNELPSFKFYWNGTIITTPGGVEYISGKSKIVKVRSLINYGQLERLIRRVIGLNDGDEIVEIYLRVPRFDERGKFVKYDAFPMKTNAHMSAMFYNVSRTPQMRLLEFYIIYYIGDSDDCDDSGEEKVENHFYGAVDDDDEDGNNDDSGDENGEGAQNAEGVEGFHDGGYMGRNTDPFQLQLSYEYTHQNVDEMHVNINLWPKNNTIWEVGKEFQQGMVFSTRSVVQTSVTSYHMQVQREYKSCRTTDKIVVLVCKNDDICNWRFRASCLKDDANWTLTRYNGPHQCTGQLITQDQRNLRARQLAEHIKTQLQMQRDIRIKTLQAGIFQSYGVKPRYKKTWYAKEKAIANMFGEWDDSFGEICNFMSNVAATNPRTVWHATGTPIVRTKENDPEIRTFKHMFWTYEPLVAGFHYCKPVVYIDVAHLYGKYEMTLLIASAIDGNNHIMPIAFALRRSETSPAWKYFMRMLKRYVLHQRKVCIISDRVEGIITTMDGPDWTMDTHKFCIRHLVSNFHTAFKRKYLKKFAEKAGRAYQVKKRDKYMGLIQRDSPQGYAYLDAFDPGKWSMSGDTTGMRHGVITINYVESVNAMLKNIRGLPVTAMLEAIFNKLVSIFTRHSTSYKEYLACNYEWTPVCAHTMQLQEQKSKTHTAVLFNVDQKIYNVTTRRDNVRQKGGNTQQVNLLARTCTCGKFQQWKIPCSHVIAACTQYGENHRQYIARFYRCEYAIRAWSAASFQPIRDRDYWIASTEIPFIPNSEWMRKKGRSVESWRRNEMD
ncbi:uncharacterized protein LOC126688149 [Mercurialis annua]|uniref:uncharacterized protein LOC126688149 n=1 Tax=Mercurialis annua TaxID=3986 RepID=UPI00215E5EC8|nr:uncharacterized protein LOC126688149 [Mercurialis annua]